MLCVVFLDMLMCVCLGLFSAWLLWEPLRTCTGCHKQTAQTKPYLHIVFYLYFACDIIHAIVLHKLPTTHSTFYPISHTQISTRYLESQYISTTTTHHGLFAVSQQFVLVWRMEQERLHGEGQWLSLERRSLICADEEHLILLVNGRADQNHLHTHTHTHIKIRHRRTHITLTIAYTKGTQCNRYDKPCSWILSTPPAQWW